MASRFLLAILLVCLSSATAFAMGIGFGYPIYNSLDFGPDITETDTFNPLAIAIAFPVNPKVSVGVAIDWYESEVGVPNPTGKHLTKVRAFPIGVLAHYYPLEGVFQPYFLGHIGPVFVKETFSEGTHKSTNNTIGPNLGFGAGASLSWPVTPFAELRCQKGFPDGDRVSLFGACGAVIGLGISF